MSHVPELRRSQLITTYGIGSILDTPDYSLMIAGQEDWLEGQMEIIHEPRLAKFLEVSEFRAPKNIKTSKYGDLVPTIPAVRFPDWHFCPVCNRLAPLSAFGGPKETSCRKCSKPKNQVTLVPSRFVIACQAGHIDDFPWNHWIHEAGCKCTRPELYISTTARSTSLASIEIECRNSGCMKKHSLEGIFSKGVGLKVGCSGKRPWLRDRVKCNEPPVVLQRGSTSVYFPAVASAISIPPFSTRASRFIDKHWATLSLLPANEAGNALNALAGSAGIDVAVLRDALGMRQRLMGRVEVPDILKEEYLALCEPPAYDTRHDFAARVEPVPDGYAAFFSRVVLIDRLRVVMALRSFSRVTPSLEKPAPLSSAKQDWLPGMEVNGEGIFIEFSAQAINAWKSRFGEPVGWRAGILEDRRRALVTSHRRTMDGSSSPEYVLIHTFAHLLLQTLTIDCGYSSAALRERIYVRPPEGAVAGMHGLLIYTTSADSEGSLGGLVRQGGKDRFGEVLAKTLEYARWCSNDPLCIESKGQGMDSTNLAACHSCALVPETSCENFNTFLDRGLLFGWPPDQQAAGFFERKW